MRNPFRRQKALTATPDVTSAIRSGWSAIPMLGSDSRQQIQNIFNTAQGSSYAWQYSNSPAVRSVVDVITRNVGQIDLRLYEEVNEQERQPRPDHPAAMSLRYPNETTPGDLFLRSVFQDYLVYGNAYMLATRAPNQQLNLERIPAYMVECQSTTLFKVDNYRVWSQGAWVWGRGGAGTYVDFDPVNVCHWHNEHPTDPRIGLSLLDTLSAVIAEDAALQAAITELANAGLTEAVWLFRPENAAELTQKTEMLMAEDIGNRLRKRNRTPVVLQEGSEFRSFGVNPRDAQMMEVRRWCVERVASVYGVPAAMVGIPSGTGDTEAMAQQSFYADTLPPICENFTRFLNHRILVQFYDWTAGAFEFNLDEKLMGNERLAALVSASGRPVLTTNEARAMVNRPPLDYGNELITPSNVISGDPAKAPKPSPGVMPIQDPNKPPQDGSARTTQPPTPIPSGNQGKKAMEDKLPQYHPRRSGDMRRQEQAIPQVEKVVRRHLGRVKRAHEQKSLANGDGEHKAFDWQAWKDVFAGDLLRVLKRIVKTEGDVYTFKFAGGEFDMGQVEHYLEAKAEGAATGIGDKFKEEIDTLGLPTAIERIPGHTSAAGGHLGVTSISFAREAAAKQSPGFQSRVKSWIADTKRHAEFDGQTIPVGQDWPQGFGPGMEKNCRCSQTVH